MQISCRLEVLTKWVEWHLGETGDWMAIRDADTQDIYIIRKTIFERTYEKAEII